VLKDMGGTGTFGLFLGLAIVSFVFIAAMAPETKGRPLEAIRIYWENGGHWPDEQETLRQLDRKRRRERGRTVST
jgi:hypothetical protein